MPKTRVLVLESQVPFVQGGAEILVRQLHSELLTRGYESAIVSIPFQEEPRDRLMAQAAIWRLVDLTSAQGRPVDIVIATKFPTYLVQHPRKVTWLAHQHRAAYELCGTVYSNFRHDERDVGLRDRLIRMDTEALGACVGRFTIAKRVSERLRESNGLESEPLYHPPQLAGRLRTGPFGEYLLAVSRLEPVKRLDLTIRTMQHVPTPTRLVIAGDGTCRPALEALVAELALADRVTFVGRVPDEELARLVRGHGGRALRTLR